MSNTRLDLAAVQARLATTQGRDYWRSLEELAETDSFQEFLHREISPAGFRMDAAMNRRNFLKLMGASLALAGLTACQANRPKKLYPTCRRPKKPCLGNRSFLPPPCRWVAMRWGFSPRAS